MPSFVPGKLYPRSEVRRAFRSAKQDGPFLLADAQSAFIGPVGSAKGEGSFPDRATLRWPGQAPKRAVEHPMLLFVERGPGEVEFVGEGRVARYTRAGSRIRDLHFDLRPPRSRAAWLEDLGDSLPPLDEPPPEAAIARLAPDAGPDDCWTALTTFLQRWHRTTLRGTGPEAPVGPPLLRKMYAIAGEIPGTFRHNDLVPPERLRVDDGRLVFLYENQAVCLWATEPQGADPKVWFRVNEPEKPWIDEPERLSGFLIQAVLFEAISHARFGAHLSGAEAAVRDSVLAHVDPLALGRWDWLGARFYARDGALAMTMENGDRFDVSLAAATPLALSVFEHIVTPDWDYVAF